MENRFNFLDWLSLVLIIIGGLNWGFIGVFDVNVVATIFGEGSAVTRVIYTLVGLGALYALATSIKAARIQTTMERTVPRT